MKRLLIVFVGLMCLVMTSKAAVVTFSSTNKPATWAKLKAAVGALPIESGADVDNGAVVVFTADEGIGYHVDWYVNDVLDESTQESQLSLTITADTKVEARYVEHFKYVFKGTPFVKYANAKGEIYVGCNAYFHRGDKARAFGYSLMSFQRSDTNQAELPDNVPYDTLYIKKVRCSTIFSSRLLPLLRPMLWRLSVWSLSTKTSSGCLTDSKLLLRKMEGAFPEVNDSASFWPVPWCSVLTSCSSTRLRRHLTM